MPPRVGSRHSFSLGFRDDDGKVFLSDREPYRFRDISDTKTHTVAQGDTLFDIAGRFYAVLPRACGYWWAIADFQPDPIIDPTLDLEPGRKVYVPSLRVLTDVILSEQRRRYES